MTTQHKKIDWSKPIRGKLLHSDACFATARDGRGIGVLLDDNGTSKIWIACEWDEYGEEKYGDPNFTVENVPEKFGRWIIVWAGESWGGAFSRESREVAEQEVAALRAEGTQAFAAYVSGSDGDVIGPEGDDNG